MVARAGEEQEEAEDTGKEALEYLCRLYWKPIYLYARAKGATAEQAEDLTQGFFQQILDSTFFSRADPGKGRFRNFLMQAFRNHVSTTFRKASTARRGGNAEMVGLDWIETAPVESEFLRQTASDTPEAIFDSQWAQITLQAAIKNLDLECRRNGRQRIFEVLEPYLSEIGTKQNYADSVARELGMTPIAVRQTMNRLRKRLATLLREVIGETLVDSSPAAIEKELSALRAAL